MAYHDGREAVFRGFGEIETYVQEFKGVMKMEKRDEQRS
jgi:hypothetical protein